MKVSITASTPQTTRNAIRGIYTDQRGQLIFTDTPGYHLGGREINRRMQEITVSSLDDSDVVLYLMDARREAGAEEDAIIEILQKVRVPVVAVINKADILTDAQKLYAATDAWACIMIHDELKRLVETGNYEFIPATPAEAPKAES